MVTAILQQRPQYSSTAQPVLGRSLPQPAGWRTARERRRHGVYFWYF